MRKNGLQHRDLLRAIVSFLSGLVIGGLTVHVAHLIRHSEGNARSEALQKITQRTKSLDALFATSPFSPGTQWLDLIVEPGYETNLPYLELAKAQGSNVLLPRKRWNNLGFPMDINVEFAKPKGIRRVLIYGDSNTEGRCANKDSFPSILQEMFDKESTGQVQVINAGISASGPLEMVLRHEHLGRLLAPDVIIFAFSLGNDLLDLFSEKRYSLHRIALGLGKGTGYAEAWPVIVREKVSGIVSEKVVFISPLRQQPSFPPVETALFNADFQEEYQKFASLLNDFKLGLAAQGARQTFLLRKVPWAMAESRNRLGYCLWRLARISATDPLKTVIVLLPAPHTLGNPDVSSLCNRVNNFLHLCGVDPIEHQQLSEVFQDTVREYLPDASLISVFGGLQGKQGTLLLQDMHFSPLGNRIIAQEVFRGGVR